MKKFILLLFLIFQMHTLYSQHLDPIVKKIKADFAEYDQTKNIQKLYAISGNLPWNIYNPKATTSKEDIDITRRERTLLYIRWIEELIESGYDINFDKHDPKNSCVKFKSVCACNAAERKLFDKQKEQNADNCKNLTKHQMLHRTMNSFKSFYKSGFRKYKKDRAHLVEIIETYCKKEDKNPAMLKAFFNKKLGKSKSL